MCFMAALIYGLH